MGGVIAYEIMYTLNLPSTINVAGEYDLQCLDKLLGTVITSFEFGECPLGTTIYTDPIVIKNTGNTEAWIGWTVTDLPAGFSIILKVQSPVIDVPQNDFSVSALAGEIWKYNDSVDGGMRLHITNESAEVGTYSFTVEFMSADGPIG